jgi:iron complex outermembrane receptor protein
MPDIRTPLLATAALLSAVTPVSGLASESGASNPGLEEVIVTARRVEERLQDTPISITVLSEDEDLDQVVPNLQFANNAPLAGNNASSQIFIRGIGQTDPTSTVDPGVGLYIDDVYMGQSVGGTMDFRDISNVQVLRGPQGTLFGRNTIGGAIVLTSTDPGDEVGGSLRLGAGTDNLLDGMATVDIPFSDTVRSRFTFGGRKQDGYVKRVQTGEDLGDTDTFITTGKLVWNPSEQLQLKLQYDYTRSNENGNPLVFAASNESATFQRVASADAGCPGFGGDWTSLPSVPLIDDERCANDFQNKGEFRNNGTYELKSKLKNSGASFHVAWDISESITLKSITSARQLDWQGIRDADNTPLTILHTAYDSDGDQFSQELQLLFHGERYTGVAGVYYFEEEIDDIVYVQLHPPPGVQEDSDNNLTENDNWAVFTQWTFDFTDALSATVGGRYTEETKASTPDQFNYNNPDAKYLPVQKYSEDFSKFTPSASVAYRFNEQAMTYLSYSEGFKSGGWNSHFNRPQTQEELDTFQFFGEEEAKTWELGAKLDLLDNTLRLNGAVFTTDYTDLQFTYRVGVAPYLANAGKASIDGFEVEATWLPTSSWVVEAGLGYLDSSIDELREIAGIAVGVEEGNRLPYTPEWQANFGVGYTAVLGSGWSITPRLDLSYQDNTFFDANNTVEIAQTDDRTVLNLGLIVESPDSAFTVRAIANNVTDEVYPIAGNSSLGTGSGYAEIAYARKAQYMLYIGYDF